MNDPVFEEAVRVAIMSLREEECIGTATVGDLHWDVYIHKMPPGTMRRYTKGKVDDAITLAVRLNRGHAIVAFMVPGTLTLEKATLLLHEGDA